MSDEEDDTPVRGMRKTSNFVKENKREQEIENYEEATRLARAIKVLYIHEGNARSQEDLSQGAVAQYLRDHFDHVNIESMNTVVGKMQECEDLQLQALHRFEPDVIVGKAFGGMLLMDLIRKGYWCGPSLLIAPAAVPGIDDFTLTKQVPIKIIYGKNDTRALSSPCVCQEILKKNNSNNDLKMIELIEIDDTYELNSLLNHMNSHKLQVLIKQIYEQSIEQKMDKRIFLPRKDEWNVKTSQELHPMAPEGCCVIS